MTREQKKDLLLKMNGLRKCNGLPWDELASIYEAESGERITARRLQFRVGSLLYRKRKLAERKAMVEIEADDLLARGEDVYARECRSRSGGFFKRLLSWLKSLFKGDKVRIRLDWAYGGFNGANAIEDTSESYGYRLTKFTFDGKTVRFDGVGAMWGYDHAHHDARNCLFFRDGDKFVGGFFEWGDPSRKSRGIKNITGRYGGWDPYRLAKATEFAFCIADKAGKRRTNVLTFRK